MFPFDIHDLGASFKRFEIVPALTDELREQALFASATRSTAKTSNSSPCAQTGWKPTTTTPSRCIASSGR